MNDPFFTVLAVVAPFAVVIAALAFGAFGRRRACPDCGDPLPALCSPFAKTRRMWLEGGRLCARCGCETDVAGRKVTPGTPPASSQAALWLMATGLLLAGVGLGAGAMLLRPSPPVPAAAAAPAMAPPLQQAPPVAPPN